jgi:hypothetical protein
MSRQRGFAAECRRQSSSLTGDAAEGEKIDWLDQVADRDGRAP